MTNVLRSLKHASGSVNNSGGGLFFLSFGNLPRSALGCCDALPDHTANRKKRFLPRRGEERARERVHAPGERAAQAVGTHSAPED